MRNTEDRGAYFIERLNLKRLQVHGQTHTILQQRLIPIGKDGLDAEYRREKIMLRITSIQKVENDDVER